VGAKHRKGDYFSESRKHFDNLLLDFERLKISSQMHVESRKEFYGKSISEIVYDSAFKKTATEMALREGARNAQQQMAMTKVGPGDWTSVHTECNVNREDVERMHSKFWEQDFNHETGLKVWQLNARLVISELKSLPIAVYNKLTNHERAFNVHFGPGAYSRSYGLMDDVRRPDPRVAPPPDRYTPEEEAMGYNRKSNFPKVAKDAAHVTQLIRPKFRPTKLMTPFEVGDPKRSVARQLEIDHNAHMADGGAKGEMFHVEHDESLLEALQRQFDVWHGIKPAKAKAKRERICEGPPTKYRNMWIGATTATGGTYTGMDLAGPHS
jgi:hypothetical protein